MDRTRSLLLDRLEKEGLILHNWSFKWQVTLNLLVALWGTLNLAQAAVEFLAQLAFSACIQCGCLTFNIWN